MYLDLFRFLLNYCVYVCVRARVCVCACVRYDYDANILNKLFNIEPVNP